MTSNGSHVVSKCRWLNSFLTVTMQKWPSYQYPSLSEKNPFVSGGFLHKSKVIRKKFQCHDIVKTRACYQIRKIAVAHAPGIQGTFSSPPRVSNHDMHHGTRCMSGLLTSGFLWSRWRGKYSRYSRDMRNSQLCVFDMRPMSTYSCNHFSVAGTLRWCNTESDCNADIRRVRVPGDNPQTNGNCQIIISQPDNYCAVIPKIRRWEMSLKM